MVGYIYLITDTTNNMKYTGKHHYNKEGELDPTYHGSGVIIKNIYKKRPETLKEEYIKTCYSEEEMCSDEQYYIEVFDTLWPNGYNLTKGGDGFIPCEEIRKKISEACKGRQLSEETKKKISDAVSGEKNYFYGKHLSEEHKKKISESHKNISDETRKKMSESQKGKHLSEEHKKKISESQKGRTAPNKGTHISEETRIKISESLKGRTPPNKGTHISEETKKKISEAQKGIQHSEETKKKISESLKGKPKSEEHKKKLSEANKGKINIKRSKPVLQFTLDGEFIREWISANEAGRNGFSQGAVCSCCNGKLPHYKGFKWCYA